MILTAVLMVKNEAHAICDTLLPLVNAGIKHIFILDTGSEDKTIDEVCTFFQKHDINGYVAEEPFIDFATSRNRALDLASEQYPDSTFFLMLDAEWHLHYGEQLLKFCENEQYTETPLYLIKIKMASLDFATARLIRASSKIRFVGAVHEVPEIATFSQVPDPIFIEVAASNYGINKSRERWRRDADLLLKSYKKNPDDPRTAFYLGQTYHCLGDLEQSLKYYQIREKLAGWEEENYVTLFRLGCVSEQLHKPNGGVSWETAMNYYLRAFGMRPHRIEPLVKLADHYWHHNIPVCYLYIRQAYNTPYPTQDVLFVEKEMYDYHRYEIMSRCAWYMNEFELGKEASRLALKVKPNTPHLINNLKLYQTKLKQMA